MCVCVCVSYRSKGVRDNSRPFTHISKKKITTAAVGLFSVCQKMTRLLAKLKPWTAVLALVGLISKVQSYARA